MINRFELASVHVTFAIGAFFAFALVYVLLGRQNNILPRDQGREFAVNGKLSAGKARGAGLIFIPVFILAALMFDEMYPEKVVYLALLAIEMITGFLDDSAKVPWGELKKGLLDLAVAIVAAVTYVFYNGSRILMPIFRLEVDLHPVLYVILAVVLIWISINAANCTDGVDGLSGTLTMVTLGSFLVLDTGRGDMRYEIILFIAVLLAYQWYNASPSILMMGDAGSRAMGFFIAIIAMKSECPFMYILLALMMILDGCLGLLKVSFIRYLHLKNFMADIRTPLHDHARKLSGWSDAQTVYRFAIIQFMVSLIALYLAK